MLRGLFIMSDRIAKASNFQNVLDSKGIDKSIGIFHSHKISIGKSNNIRIDEISSKDVHFAGFKKSTKIARGLEGLNVSANNVIDILSNRTENLNVESLLGSLKAHLVHFERLDKLGKIKQEHKGNYLNSYVNSVYTLSNNKLAAVYQTLTSAQMDFLQEALMEEGRTNPNAKDARRIASMLFDIQGLVLKEISNRSSYEKMVNLEKKGELSEEDVTAIRKHKSLKGEFEDLGLPNNVVRKEVRNDMTASNLLALTEISAKSANNREKNAEFEKKRLENRKIDNVTLKEMGDVIRNADLTMNIQTNYLISGPNSIFDHPNDPMVNIFHLKNQGIIPKGHGYNAEREKTENILFPEFEDHEVNANERPLYAAVNYRNNITGAAPSYGNSVIVFKKDVAKRATYMLDDSFKNLPLKIDEKRKQNFLTLLTASEHFPKQLKDAINNTDSLERKELESFLNKFSDPNKKILNTEITANNFTVIRSHFVEDNLPYDSTQMAYFRSLMIEAFGDKESTRNSMSTYENIESLLPQLGDVAGNNLANAAMKKKNGQDPSMSLKGYQYIEVELHGPIIPTLDIEEIKIDLKDVRETQHLDDEQLEAFIARCQKFGEDNGIKISFISENELNRQDELTRRDLGEIKFNSEHVDKTRLEQLKEEYLKNIKEKVENYIKTYKLRNNIDFSPELLVFERSSFLDKVGGKFIREIEDYVKTKHEIDASQIVTKSFDKVVKPMLERKIQVLSAMNKFPINEAQKKAFAKLITGDKDLDSVEELKIIFNQVQQHTHILREILSSNPPKSDLELLQMMTNYVKGFVNEFEPYIKKMKDAGKEIGLDNVLWEVTRISRMSMAMLKFGEPPMNEDSLRKMHETLNSPVIRGLISKIQGIMEFSGDHGSNEGLTNAALLPIVFNENALNSAYLINQNYSDVPHYSGDFGLIPQAYRNILKELMPNTIQDLDKIYPAYKTIAVPSQVEALPQDDMQLRNFCVNVLDEYINHEKTFEKGTSYHGRGHIARAFIFANVMSNILIKKYNVKVDKNAVLCGISCHDLGRKGTGDDKWEQESAKITIEKMKQQFGEDALGPDYTNDIEGCINKKSPNHNTIEAMLIESADSLDISRVLNFDPDLFPFMKNKNMKDSGEEYELRKELEKEAKLLQILTDPLCANKNVLEYFDQESFNSPSIEISKVYQAQKREYLEMISKKFEQDWNLSSEDFLKRIEDIVRENKQMFPLLNEYYMANV